MKFKIIIALGIIIASGIHIFVLLGLNQFPISLNDKDCQKIKTNVNMIGSEDIIKYSQSILITSTADHFKAFEFNENIQGQLNVIYDADTNDP